MAEENKLNIFDVNNESDDIQESISNANKVTDDVVKKAAEKIAERRKEKLTNELIDVVQKCEYTEKSAALQLRRSNRVNQRMKTYMKDLKKKKKKVKSAPQVRLKAEREMGFSPAMMISCGKNMKHEEDNYTL